ETAAKHGEEQVKIWRRSFDIPPPALEASDPMHPRNDPRYAELDPRVLPGTESLKLTIDRVLPYWHDVLVPTIRSGKRVVIAAHGNSLRALIKYLDDLSDEAIVALNVPTAVPLVYELDANMRPIKNYYLADPEELKKLMDAVANQGKAK
ncbi:MAG: 2,3-bisphosphoglycerate-dependent phosphoglycerate mutase, partial [Candidatus Competibacteraceae bacterium]|nr:2,3-bisphosphoglycerate-dependent phosphoglycerate mutase [Candidatus Competibacteraceae bacterium]